MNAAYRFAGCVFFFFSMAVRGVITEADENSVSRISRRRFNKNISAFKTDSVSRSLWERQKTNKHRCAAIWAEAARHRHVFSSIEQTQIEPHHKKKQDGEHIGEDFTSLHPTVQPCSDNKWPLFITHWSATTSNPLTGEQFWSCSLWMGFVLSRPTDVASFCCCFCLMLSCLRVHK